MMNVRWSDIEALFKELGAEISEAEGLKREGKASLEIFLRMCAEDGVSPKKPQGRFALRLDPEIYHEASVAAAANGVSLNQWIVRAVRE